MIFPSGLKERCDNDANFALKIRFVDTLAFIPPELVIKAFSSTSSGLFRGYVDWSSRKKDKKASITRCGIASNQLELERRKQTIR